MSIGLAIGTHLGGNSDATEPLVPVEVKNVDEAMVKNTDESDVFNVGT